MYIGKCTYTSHAQHDIGIYNSFYLRNVMVIVQRQDPNYETTLLGCYDSPL